MIEKTFELEWKLYGNADKIYGRNEYEQKEYFFNQFAKGFNKKWFRNKKILDAGCGHGTFVKILAEMGAKVIGVDINEEICRIASRKVKHLKNSSIIQYDLLDSNIKNLGKFDFVFSNGVIHHTPNPRLAFKNLARLVNGGGYLGIWVYPKGSALWEGSNKLVRFFTAKLPKKLLYYLCYLTLPLMCFVPVYSGINPNKNTWKECVQCAYDWLAPQYQSHHKFKEIKQWFEEEGFTNIKQTLIPTGAVGIKSDFENKIYSK